MGENKIEVLMFSPPRSLLAESLFVWASLPLPMDTALVKLHSYGDRSHQVQITRILLLLLQDSADNAFLLLLVPGFP